MLRDSPIDTLMDLMHYHPVAPATSPLRRRYPREDGVVGTGFLFHLSASCIVMT